MMKILRVVAVGVAVLSMSVTTTSVTFAHEGHDHGSSENSVKGTVESLTGNKLTLKGTDGQSVNVHVDEQTKYENGHAAGSPADLVAGTRVVVHGDRMGDGTVHAATIRYVKAATKHEHEHHKH